MTRFQDGPAFSAVLTLQRAPFFLRVVRNNDPDSQFDALDQLNDRPEPHEELFAYQLTCRPATAFIDGAKFRGRCMIANYRLVTDQPTDAVMRDSVKWASWCDANQHLADGII